MQFKVSLKGIKPPIWRRLEVPCTYTFWDLHVAIQDSMGWLDSHLHAFRIRNPLTQKLVEIGIPGDEMFPGEEPMLAGWNVFVAQYFTLHNREADYEYDFGDSWEHSVLLEKVRPRRTSIEYPVSVGGKRACPPEDCGGPGGYSSFLQAIGDPSHEEHQSMLQRAGGA